MFKKGDVVIHIRDENNPADVKHMTIGKQYIVTWAGKCDGNGEVLFVRVVRDNGTAGTFFESRFQYSKQVGVFKEGDRVVLSHLPEWDEHIEDYMYPVPGTDRMVRSPGFGEYMTEAKGAKGILVLKERDEYAEEDGLDYENWKIKFDDPNLEEKYDCHVWSIAWFTHEAGVAAPQEPHKDWVVGEYVYVAKKPTDGVLPRWIDKLDKTIGKKYKVKEVHKTHLVLSNGMAYHYSSVEKYVPAKHDKPKQKSLRQLVADTRAKAKAANLNSLCAFAIIVKDAKGILKQHHRFSAPCHYDLQNDNKGAVAVIDFLEFHNKKHLKDDPVKIKMYRKWVDSVANRSPFSACYIPKDGKNHLKNGADMNVNCSTSAIAGAAVFMRHATETVKYLESFYYWHKEVGVSERTALLISYCYDKPNKAHVDSFGMLGGHETLCQTMHIGSLLSFWKNGYDAAHIDGSNPISNGKKYSIHESIDSTTIDPEVSAYLKERDVKADEKLVDALQKLTNSEIKGAGWHRKLVTKSEDCIAFAKSLDILFGEAA